MKFTIDKSLAELGITSVVLAIARNVDPQAPLSEAFLQKQKEAENWALNCNLAEITDQPTIQGYCDLLQKVGRSVKKNPPTVPALIRNIQHRGSIPRINSVIDIYNVESLHSLLAIGGHDLDKIGDEIEFTVSQKDDIFLPILSKEKRVAPTDYVYRDEKGILAWLDVRDSDLYKFDDSTKNAIFIIQGNAHTSVQMRLEALERIQQDLAAAMPDLEFETHVVQAESL
ncbi:B3/4 domain-containing protein [Streptococcus sp. Marseille-P7375]|uniref:B3/B4 domain-containing protein n=1 Tax=Streptococcus sp. Marseille-P7375 TaxID=2487318 RepID=UPI0011E7D7D8|nr:phenylalanine--tRNA ligase beta subunit-related protein [Streptococcus sp. Marseille-P7375]